MKIRNALFATLPIVLFIFPGFSQNEKFCPTVEKQWLISSKDQIIKDSILYHPVRLSEDRTILPWYSSNPGQSYDTIVKLVWNFWDKMELDSNGEKYYMNHQVWIPEHDSRGLGGDQIMMALSSWDLLYDYTGNKAILENMKNIANHYLTHSLSQPGSQWPDLPFPYNTDVEAASVYDGDMILGKGYLQPDKAGSFGFELLKLYKKTGDEKYLSSALKIANTLASKVQKGDNDNSPWPFKVNAKTGEAGLLVDQASWDKGMSENVEKTDPNYKKSVYTTNWTSTLELFSGLINLQKDNKGQYKKAFDIAIDWLKAYPAKTNKWGPFFEDVQGWSDTQTNAITYAMYIIQHPDLDPNWKETVNNIFHWVHKELDNKEFIEYGVTCVNEQTSYRVPGNSHSSRQASVELMYWEKTKDTTYVRNDIRMLNWATYMVDWDGKNCYPHDNVWMTDGYGDYVRHYLRAMAAMPQLAPDNSDHLLKSSSIVKNINYTQKSIAYNTFDQASEELFRMQKKPTMVMADGTKLNKTTKANNDGWMWQNLETGGVLKVRHNKGAKITIVK